MNWRYWIWAHLPKPKKRKRRLDDIDLVLISAWPKARAEIIQALKTIEEFFNVSDS